MYGKTKQQIQKRLHSHISSRNKTPKVSRWILGLYNKGKRPIIELLDICDENNWEDIERYWISQCKAWGFNLMNTTLGGESGCETYRHTEEAKRKISILNSRPKSQQWINNVTIAVMKSTAVPIVQLDKKNNFIKEWESFSFAAKKTNPLNYKAAIKNIHACCNNKRNTAYGFKWIYKSVDL